MKISVRQIPSGGLKVEKSFSPQEMGLADKEIRCTAPIVVLAKVERINNSVSVDAYIRSKFAFFCARCLEPVESPRDDKFRFHYMVDNKTEFIDIGDDIRQ